MNTKTIVAALLITFGGLILAYAGISYTTQGDSVDFFGLHIETKERHFIPPTVGAFALLSGIVLLLVKPKSI